MSLTRTCSACYKKNLLYQWQGQRWHQLSLQSCFDSDSDPWGICFASKEWQVALSKEPRGIQRALCETSSKKNILLLLRLQMLQRHGHRNYFLGNDSAWRIYKLWWVTWEMPLTKIGEVLLAPPTPFPSLPDRSTLISPMLWDNIFAMWWAPTPLKLLSAKICNRQQRTWEPHD